MASEVAGVAWVSKEPRPKKKNVFLNDLGLAKCLQNSSKMTAKTDEKAFKN